jgi:NAD+ synthase (glutamine-hydrolysing)
MKFFTRVAAVSPTLYLGEPHKNIEEFINTLETLNKKNVDVVVFPELSVVGYTCGDLFYQDSLLNKCLEALDIFLTKNVNNYTITIIGMPINYLGRLFNCAIVIQQDKILGIVPKSYIPNSLEYYEKRWFSSGLDLKNRSINLLKLKDIPFGVDLLFESSTGLVLGVEICEDLWAVIPPSSSLALAGANLIANLSASNELVGKSEYRKELVSSHSAKCITSYVYANSGIDESTTDIVFSGHSFIVENGIVLAELKPFVRKENYIIADIDIDFINYERKHSSSFNSLIPNDDFRYIPFITFNHKIEKFDTLRIFGKTPFVPQDDILLSKSCNQILEIQIFALIKRLKFLRYPKVIIGISGGLDSTLALLVCVKAFQILELSFENIITVSMPGFGTTDRTFNNSIELAKKLSVKSKRISIVDSVKQHFKDIEFDEQNLGIVFENAQARERTQILMDIANQYNGIVLGTGDLSEAALGWCTFNGDHISMYHINSGVPKTLVQSLIKHMINNDEYLSNISDLLLDILDTPITPELLPIDNSGIQKQLTESSVGPYKLNDFFLYYFLRRGYTENKLLSIALFTFNDEFEPEEIRKWHRLFFNRFYSQQFKRSVMPDGPKVGSVSLSPRGDWRMPSDFNYSYKL